MNKNKKTVSRKAKCKIAAAIGLAAIATGVFIILSANAPNGVIVLEYHIYGDFLSLLGVLPFAVGLGLLLEDSSEDKLEEDSLNDKGKHSVSQSGDIVVIEFVIGGLAPYYFPPQNI